MYVPVYFSYSPMAFQMFLVSGYYKSRLHIPVQCNWQQFVHTDFTHEKIGLLDQNLELFMYSEAYRQIYWPPFQKTIKVSTYQQHMNTPVAYEHASFLTNYWEKNTATVFWMI